MQLLPQASDSKLPVDSGDEGDGGETSECGKEGGGGEASECGKEGGGGEASERGNGCDGGATAMTVAVVVQTGAARPPAEQRPWAAARGKQANWQGRTACMASSMRPSAGSC